MLVYIQRMTGAVRVTQLSRDGLLPSGGPMSPGGVIVRPGQAYRGYKYTRLRRLGTGRHELRRRPVVE